MCGVCLCEGVGMRGGCVWGGGGCEGVGMRKVWVKVCGVGVHTVQ